MEANLVRWLDFWTVSRRVLAMVIWMVRRMAFVRW
jgi:hypothetical protein